MVAVATDLATYEAAVNSDYAGDYNWPTLNGGIESGGIIWYRNEIDYGDSGECGPIVAIDDLSFDEDIETNTLLDYVISPLR